MNRALLVIVSLFALAFSLPADPLTLSASGTFSSTTPATAWTVPSENWSFSFTLDSNPPVLSSLGANESEVAVTNFIYDLNGTPVNVAPVDVVLYSAANDGLFNVCFLGCSGTMNPIDGFVFEGTQAYAGAESAPTILTGIYTTTLVDAYTSGSFTVEPNLNIAITGSSAPELSSFLFMVLGSSFLVLRAKKRIISL